MTVTTSRAKGTHTTSAISQTASASGYGQIALSPSSCTCMTIPNAVMKDKIAVLMNPGAIHKDCAGFFGGIGCYNLPPGLELEAFDDGNKMDGDGCSSTCTVEPNHRCNNKPCNSSSCNECVHTCPVAGVDAQNGVKLPSGGHVLAGDTVNVQCDTGYCCFPANHPRCLHHFNYKRRIQPPLPRQHELLRFQRGCFRSFTTTQCKPCQCAWSCPASTTGTKSTPAQGVQITDRDHSGSRVPSWTGTHAGMHRLLAMLSRPSGLSFVSRVCITDFVSDHPKQPPPHPQAVVTTAPDAEAARSFAHAQAPRPWPSHGHTPEPSQGPRAAPLPEALHRCRPAHPAVQASRQSSHLPRSGARSQGPACALRLNGKDPAGCLAMAAGPPKL